MKSLTSFSFLSNLPRLLQLYAPSENVSLLPLVVRLNSVKTACWMNIIMLLGSTAVSIAAFGKSFDASIEMLLYHSRSKRRVIKLQAVLRGSFSIAGEFVVRD